MEGKYVCKGGGVGKKGGGSWAHWPLPTAAIEDWEMIRAMREAGDSPEDAGAADEPPPLFT